jgi:hypothetical protein
MMSVAVGDVWSDRTERLRRPAESRHEQQHVPLAAVVEVVEPYAIDLDERVLGRRW